MTQKTEDQKLSAKEMKKLKQIVLARLSVMPEDMSVSVGDKNLGKTDLAAHVEAEDEIGRQMMEMELEFLQDLAKGVTYGNE